MMPKSEKPPLEDPNRMQTLNSTLYSTLRSPVSPPPYQMPAININQGHLEVDTDEETQEMHKTLKELQEHVKMMIQGQKEMGCHPEKEPEQADPVVRPKFPKPTFNQRTCHKATLSTLKKHTYQTKRGGADPSGGFAGAEYREQQTRMIKNSNKEVPAGEGEKSPDNIRIPATFIGELEIADTTLSLRQDNDNSSGSGRRLSESESWRDDELEGEELGLIGDAVDEEGAVSKRHVRSRGPILGRAQLQAPLIQKQGGQNPIYVPFTITDINRLVEKMPPPAEVRFSV